MRDVATTSVSLSSRIHIILCHCATDNEFDSYIQCHRKIMSDGIDESSQREIKKRNKHEAE